MRWIEEGRQAGGCLVVGLLLGPLACSFARAQSPANPPPAPPAVVRPVPRFVVVIDAAHGGADSGARLSDHLLEKDLVLNLSVRLRSMLSAHGISVVTTRESDSAITASSRAETANHVGAAACITLHATTSGSGIHLFTASLTPVPMTRFLPWETAQGAYAEQSLKLSSEFDSAMTHAEIPVTLGRTALRPLDSFTCPAVVVEISPFSGKTHVTALSDPEYQDRIVAALAAAIEQWQRDWRQQP
ncbi:MAG: N-acetylmuramoyl-L-alanine amidase [Acidobacteriaceae bacterium]|jgi:N-acetylmuramoyl-L-alanine amidase|nr:N-acetylmuramoyl-L-alanine amidase [Acidobacteriaceae bacterium]